MTRFFAAALFLCLSGGLYAYDRPIVTDLQASPGSGTKINLLWKLPGDPQPKISKLFVFRDRKPIVSFSDISESEPVAALPPTAVTWADTVRDYSDYYYAVTAVAGGRQYDIVIASINATVKGVHLRLPEKPAAADSRPAAPEKLYQDGTLRETPLPYLDLLEDHYQEPKPMSSQAYAAAKTLSGRRKRTVLPLDFYVFETDLVSPDGGDDFLLFEILRTTFIRKRYQEAVAELEKLLGTNRAAAVMDRAAFYLGESYYFTGNYKEAVMNFLTVYDVYPVLAKKWIDSALDLLSAQRG